MPRPVHFEVHAADPDRAQRFYETVLGWHLPVWGDGAYRLITTGPDAPGINGGMLATARRGGNDDDAGRSPGFAP